MPAHGSASWPCRARSRCTLRALGRLGATAVEVRTPAELDAVDALVMPGGESTTMSKLLVSMELFEPLAERLAEGMPALGTCAGMILLAREILDGRPDQRCVRRHRHLRAPQRLRPPGRLVRGRPRRRRRCPRRRSTPCSSGRPSSRRSAPTSRCWPRSRTAVRCACRQGKVMVTSFHPELSPDLRLHELFLRELAA